MAEFRKVMPEMWRADEWFQELPTDGRLLWIYLCTGPSVSIAGIYKIPLKTMSFEVGLPIERVAELLRYFAESDKAYYEGSILWVCNLRRYQAGANPAPTVLKCIEQDLAKIPYCSLKQRYCIQYGYSIDTVPIPAPIIDVDVDVDVDKTETETESVNGANTAPLDACLAALPQAKNKPAVIGQLFATRFGSTYPPNYGRLGKLAKELSGGYIALAQLIWASSAPAGDPHDYLTKMAGNSPANLQPGRNGSGPPRGHEHPGITAIRIVRERERKAAEEDKHGNPT